jgi:GT2 family glycosyltransferase
MDVSVIIVNYNTTVLSCQAIASVIEYTAGLQYEIIVIDNASSDRSIATIQQQFPEIRLILNEDNRGFGAANNQGMAIAAGEYYFLLNSDAYLRDNALASFLTFMRTSGKESYGVAGAELSTGTTRPTVSFGNFPTVLELMSSFGFYIFYKSYYLKQLNLGVVNYDEQIKEVDFISGAAMFIRKSVIDKAGRFDEEFFLYFEETELSFRIRKAGYKSVILPFIKIIHLEGSSQVSTTFNYKRYEHFARSRNLFYKKSYGSFYAALAKMLYFIHVSIFSPLRREKGSLIKKLGIIAQS